MSVDQTERMIDNGYIMRNQISYTVNTFDIIQYYILKNDTCSNFIA